MSRMLSIIESTAARLFRSSGMGEVQLRRSVTLRVGTDIAASGDLEIDQPEIALSTSLVIRGTSSRKLRGLFPFGLKLVLNTQDLTVLATSRTEDGKLVVSIDPPLSSPASIGDLVTFEEFAEYELGQGILENAGSTGGNDEASRRISTTLIERSKLPESVFPAKDDVFIFPVFFIKSKIVNTGEDTAGAVRINT